jgi:hypothetical protein
MRFSIRSILILTLAVALISPLLRELVEMNKFAQSNATVNKALLDDFGVIPMADYTLQKRLTP